MATPCRRSCGFNVGQPIRRRGCGCQSRGRDLVRAQSASDHRGPHRGRYPAALAAAADWYSESAAGRRVHSAHGRLPGRHDHRSWGGAARSSVRRATGLCLARSPPQSSSSMRPHRRRSPGSRTTGTGNSDGCRSWLVPRRHGSPWS